MCVVIVKIVESKSPVHGDVRGFRIKVTSKNSAKYVHPRGNGQKPYRTESFDWPYLLCQSGDYNTMLDAIMAFPSYCEQVMDWFSASSWAGPSKYPV